MPELSGIKCPCNQGKQTFDPFIRANRELHRHKEQGQKKQLTGSNGEVQYAMASHSHVSSINQAGSPSHAPVEKPSAPPTNILHSKLAQAYSYAHPVLLLTLCAARFKSLVANPVQELLTDLPWLALLQLFYVILCLPPAASPPADSSSASDAKAVRSRSGKPGYRRKNSGKNVWAAVWAKLMVCAPIVYS